jgi:hypothetical protein
MVLMLALSTHTRTGTSFEMPLISFKSDLEPSESLNTKSEK